MGALLTGLQAVANLSDPRRMVMGLSITLAIIIFGLMILALIRHRQSKSPTPRPFHKRLGHEILWTLIPILMIIALAFPAVRDFFLSF